MIVMLLDKLVNFGAFCREASMSVCAKLEEKHNVNFFAGVRANQNAEAP
jgi:hypothetical protein